MQKNTFAQNAGYALGRTAVLGIGACLFGVIAGSRGLKQFAQSALAAGKEAAEAFKEGAAQEKSRMDALKTGETPAEEAVPSRCSVK